MHRRQGRSGFTLLEVMIGLAVLAIALFGLLSAVLHLSRFNAENREILAATRGAERIIETLRNAPFDQVFRSYNADPSDDPGGPGSAPGAAFDVEGLVARPGDPDGKCGRILFPTNGTTGQLREDTADADLMMPRDLNRTGVVEHADVSANAVLLPVTILIEWQGIRGPESRTFRTVLMKR